MKTIPKPKISIELTQAKTVYSYPQVKKKNTEEDKLSIIISTKCKIFLDREDSLRNQKPP
jgi:hypothetical protein